MWAAVIYINNNNSNNNNNNHNSLDYSFIKCTSNIFLTSTYSLLSLLLSFENPK